MDIVNKVFNGNALSILKTMQTGSINCCVTSPPYYGLRDYGSDAQVGQENTPDEFIANLVDIFMEVHRVMQDDGTLWVNLGDTFAKKNYKAAGIKRKDMVGVPWAFAFALRDKGWYLRNEIIWHKVNPFPEGVTDRCTQSHEHIFMFTKNAKYYYDIDAIKEPAIYAGHDRGARPDRRRDTEYKPMNGKTGDFRIKRDVWTVINKPDRAADHYASYPTELIEPCILAGCPADGIVLDPFFGTGTTGVAAKMHGRNYVGIDVNAEYCLIAEKRLRRTMFN